MPLLEIRAEFKSLVAVLTRIADALDRAHPYKPHVGVGDWKPEHITHDRISHVTEESLWKLQNEPDGEKVEQRDDILG